tara:strand:- start:592 stop:747 length:156 start_codon:yes stop_codon:yes gene_type:complete
LEEVRGNVVVGSCSNQNLLKLPWRPHSVALSSGKFMSEVVKMQAFLKKPTF